MTEINNSTSNDIWTAVTSAIDSGVSAKEFLDTVEEQWKAALVEKITSDAKVFDHD